MKHWHGQAFPIVVLGLLAGLSFWLQSAVDLDPGARDGKLRHDPDAIGEEMVARRFDARGQLKYRLTTPYSEHFPDDDTSLFRSPILTSFREGQAPLTIRADNAKATSEGTIVFLWDNVRVERAATADRPALIGQSPDLTANTETGIAFTSSPVEITQGASRVTGVGARIDTQASTFVLQSQVKGQYIRPGTKP